MMRGICRFCGEDSSGLDFWAWVKPTFTDHDKIRPGQIVCENCLFWFDEASLALAERVGKDKPQSISEGSAEKSSSKRDNSRPIIRPYSIAPQPGSNGTALGIRQN